MVGSHRYVPTSFQSQQHLLMGGMHSDRNVQVTVVLPCLIFKLGFNSLLTGHLDVGAAPLLCYKLFSHKMLHHYTCPRQVE